MPEPACTMNPQTATRGRRPRLPAWPSRGSAASGALAIALAAVASMVFLWSGGRDPMPLLPWSAAFLFFVVEEDLRHRRIPNWLTLPTLGAALVFAHVTGGWAGTAAAAGGAGVAFGLLFPLFLFRVMGAGDVKALMVLGAFWGPAALVGSLWWMLVAGGLVAIAIAGLRGALPDVLSRWKLSLLTFVATRRLTYFPPAAEGTAGTHIPFGVAIALGAAAHQYWGAPWA